jgi:UDP-N-acetylmuramate--alanine ligase
VNRVQNAWLAPTPGPSPDSRGGGRPYPLSQDWEMGLGGEGRSRRERGLGGEGRPHSVHLVGIGGAHMSAIAQMLMAAGMRVSGSDLQETETTRRLAALGATVCRGHAAEHVGDVDLVVMTAAAKADNPEVLEARRRGIPVIARAEMVARLMEGRTGVAVAGSAGKTTTSSLIAYLLHRAGRAPSYLLGGDAPDLGGNAAAGGGPYIVVEADEYARAFLEYRPDVAVVTNVEPDHLDYYGSVEAYVDAFRRFMRRVPAGGAVIGCADSPLLAALLDEPAPATVQRYRVVPEGGDVAGVDWLAVDEGPTDAGGHGFTLLRQGAPVGQFETALPGRHNVSNATGALAAGFTLGLTAEEMRGPLRKFRGARRRFETVGAARGVTIIDDYAHHPVKVRATIAAARERFPDRRLVVLYQPHTYSRTAYALEGFRDCFAGAGALYILETYAARETPDAGMSAEALARAIRTPAARYVPSIQEAVETLRRDLRPGDVVFTMGAGDVTAAGPALLAALRES